MKTTFTRDLVEVRHCFNFTKKQALYLFNRSERTNDRHDRLFNALLAASTDVKEVEYDYHFGPHIWVTMYVHGTYVDQVNLGMVEGVLTDFLGETGAGEGT